MAKTYRPTVEDMTFTQNFKKLSLREAGKFDWETWGKEAAAKKAQEGSKRN